jgi:peroxiredoxin
MPVQLTSGAAFPEISLQLTDGNNMSLPMDLSTPLTVVLFYRGHW